MVPPRNNKMSFTPLTPAERQQALRFAARLRMEDEITSLLAEKEAAAARMSAEREAAKMRDARLATLHAELIKASNTEAPLNTEASLNTAAPAQAVEEALAALCADIIAGTPLGGAAAPPPMSAAPPPPPKPKGNGRWTRADIEARDGRPYTDEEWAAKQKKLEYNRVAAAKSLAKGKGLISWIREHGGVPVANAEQIGLLKKQVAEIQAALGAGGGAVPV